MQDIFDTLLLSLIQGIAELLPISSSAHMQIFIKDLSLKPFVEAGAFLAVLAYFSPLILGNLKGVFVGSFRSFMFFAKVIVATIPFGMFFILFAKFFTFQSIGLFLILGSILMIIAEKFKTERTVTIDDISLKQAFAIGVFQIFAFFSGFSRSGSTISAGLLFGLKRSVAVRFSFLISLPLTFASLIYDFYKHKPEFNLQAFLAFTLCFFIAIITIKTAFKILSNFTLYPFICYRLILAIILLFSA